MKLSRWTTVCGAALATMWVLVSVSVSGQARPAAQAAAPRAALGRGVQERHGAPRHSRPRVHEHDGIFRRVTCLELHRLPRRSQRERLGQLRGHTPLKNRARQIIRMVNAINEANFGGRPFVTCYTCHRGSRGQRPSRASPCQYGEPPPDHPDGERCLAHHGSRRSDSRQVPASDRRRAGARAGSRVSRPKERTKGSIRISRKCQSTFTRRGRTSG